MRKLIQYSMPLGIYSWCHELQPPFGAVLIRCCYRLPDNIHVAMLSCFHCRPIRVRLYRLSMLATFCFGLTTILGSKRNLHISKSTYV